MMLAEQGLLPELLERNGNKPRSMNSKPTATVSSGAKKRASGEEMKKKATSKKAKKK